MPPPGRRPRALTIRRLMVVIALVAVALGVVTGLRRRSLECARLSNRHRISSLLSSSTTRGRYHDRMADRYDRVARYPWLPLPPAPSEAD